MLCEALWHLSPFGDLKTYRYVGFGSYYFADFSLFHKQLGVSNMVSIEGDTAIKRQRFISNLPFKCVKIKFGMSSTELPKLQWDSVRTILWLDYDYALDGSVLTDIDFFCQHACPGSVLMITVDANPAKEEDSTKFEHLSPIDHLKSILGEDKVPAGTKSSSLDGWGRARVYRKIITEEIEVALAKRNNNRDKANRFNYQQLFNFHYRDSAMMLTVGGILFDSGTEPKLASCGFNKLDTYRPGEKPFLIRVPKLTFREIRSLNEKLPLDDGDRLDFPSIPAPDLNMYKQIYRWFPTFAEMDL